MLRDRTSPRAYFTTVLAHAGHKNAAFRPLVLELLFASVRPTHIFAPLTKYSSWSLTAAPLRRGDRCTLLSYR